MPRKNRTKGCWKAFQHTDETDALIIAAYKGGSLSLESLSRQTGASVRAVRYRAEKLGLTKSYRLYSTKEERIIREFYPSSGGAAECARRLPGRTLVAIIDKAHRMGLHSGNTDRGGDRNSQTKIPDQYIHVIRTKHEIIWPGMTIRQKAKRIGISESQLGQIIRGKERIFAKCPEAA
jgi:lambda repressor-like predicted transcriptional regulator